jgi:hypothetical protein
MGHYDRDEDKPHSYSADDRRDSSIRELWIKVNHLSDVVSALHVDVKQLKSAGVKLPLKITKV